MYTFYLQVELVIKTKSILENSQTSQNQTSYQ